VSSYKKILLYREDFLDRCVSLNIAKFTNKWHYTDSTEIVDYNDFKIHINPITLLSYFNSIKVYYNDILSKFKDVTIVRYEDLVNMEDLQYIIKNLGLTLNFKGGDIPTKYINPSKDNHKCITNYEEILNISSFKLIFDGKKFI
jgi:hypothetical protein